MENRSELRKNNPSFSPLCQQRLTVYKEYKCVGLENKKQWITMQSDMGNGMVKLT